jgi:Glycosyl transferases group 1
MQHLPDQALHIVSFNVPYPPNYRGVIDIFSQLKAYHALGIKVHLHCFSNGREESPELAALCSSVSYYPHKSFYQALYSGLPYIVGVRQSDELLKRLVEDDYPVLFEGLHTCLYLNHEALAHKKKFVRVHGVDWDYFRTLGAAASNYFRKLYLEYEARKLKNFELGLEKANRIIAINRSDYNYFKEQFQSVSYVPAFHANEQVSSKTGSGSYVLYHGNLEAVENNQSAMFLLTRVFNNTDIPLVIAGKKPNDTLKKIIAKMPSVKLVENPSNEALTHLIEDAHINILPTFQTTGIRLKLINAMFKGRFVIANENMVSDSHLGMLCAVEDEPEKMLERIKELMQIPFTESLIQHRKEILMKFYSNEFNAKEMARIIFDDAPSYLDSPNTLAE